MVVRRGVPGLLLVEATRVVKPALELGSRPGDAQCAVRVLTSMCALLPMSVPCFIRRLWSVFATVPLDAPPNSAPPVRR